MISTGTPIKSLLDKAPSNAILASDFLFTYVSAESTTNIKASEFL